MGNLLKESFNEIRAEDDIKRKTERIVLNEINKSSKAFKFRYLKAVATTCVCLFVFLLVGNWLYFTPTSEINVDINPSIGLGVNRFNNVVSVDGLNEDGLELADKLNLKYENYEDALSQLLNSEAIKALLAEGNKVVITVTGSNSDQASQIVAQIEINSSEYANASCHEVSTEEAREAHDLGLSYGKYKAYLELKELDSSFTPEELQDMSMKEIQDLIDKLSETKSSTIQTSNSNQEVEQSTEVQENNGNGEHHSNGHDTHH